MVRRVIGTVAAASALTANAFLIPPGTQSIDNTPHVQIINTEWQAVKLPCPDCVLPSRKSESVTDDADFFIQGGANSLLVNVTTLFEGRAIGLPNDYPLYPPLASFNKATVDMVSSEASLIDLQKTADRRHTVKVSADSMFMSEEKVDPKGNAIIHIKYHIISVDNHPVTVDAIEVTCLKDSEDKLMLISAQPLAGPSTIFDALTPTAPRPPVKAVCSLPPLVCQWRDFVEAKVAALRQNMPKHFGMRTGCAGRKGTQQGSKHPWADENGDVHLPSHIRPHLPHFAADAGKPNGHRGMNGRPHHRPESGHRGQHGHHGHHRHHHHSFHAIVRGFLMILVPIFLGITMGMAVSIVGMIIGRLIAFVWIRFVRGGQRGYASVRLSEEDAEIADAHAEEHDEPLPVYEDAPAYEEKPKEMQ